MLTLAMYLPVDTTCTVLMVRGSGTETDPASLLLTGGMPGFAGTKGLNGWFSAKPTGGTQEMTYLPASLGLEKSTLLLPVRGSLLTRMKPGLSAVKPTTGG